MRQVLVLGGVLAVALVGSYVTWTAEEQSEAKPGEVEIYAGTDLSRVVWTSEKADVELRPASDAKGDYVMVHLTERREKPTGKPPAPPEDPHGHGDDHPEEGEPEAAPEGGAGAEGAPDAPAEAPPEIETIVSYFKGNQEAEDLMKALAPLKAMRELVVPAGTDTTAFGFAEPTATLEVSRGSGSVKLAVGGETFGAKDRYVQADGRTYLVDDQTLRPLQYGKTRLIERNLQPLAEADVERVEVFRGAQTATFVQVKPEGEDQKPFWADAASPDTEHQVAGPWLGKVFKLRVREFVQPDALPTTEPVFRFVVHGKDAEGEAQTWTVDVTRAPGDTEAYYAQADFLRSTVELTASLAAGAVTDLPSVFPEE